MRPPKLYPALLGGLFTGVLSVLPYVKEVNGCCCLWMAVGGFLAAYVMQQNHPQQVTLNDGAQVGLLAGVFGFFLMLIASIPVTMLTGPSPSAFSQGVLGSRDGVNPEVRELMRSIPPWLIGLFAGALFLSVGAVVSTIGGLVGAAFFRRSAPPAGSGLPPPAMPDAPPAAAAVPFPTSPPSSPSSPPPLPPPDGSVTDAPGHDEGRAGPAWRGPNEPSS